MSMPSQPPPLSLLRLREADVVRLCGLGSTALGLDLITRRALSETRRDGARLSAAVIAVDETPLEAWAEVTGETPTVALRWECARHAPAAEERRPGCEHIAAILTAWIRAPADFVTPLAAGATPAAPRDPIILPLPPPEPRAERGPMQPRLLNAPRQPRPRMPLTLGDELRRLPAQEVIGIARRTLGAEMDETEARSALETALSDRAVLRSVLAKLDAEANETLAWLRLAGGALTSADLDALAARAGKPVSGLRSALTALERHGLVFAALLGSSTEETLASATEAGDEAGWRRLKGWRIARETRDALASKLPIPTFERPGAAEVAHQAKQRLRVEPGSPRAMLLALALLARAPAPLGPFAIRSSDAPARPEQSERRGRSGSALTPEDLPDAQAHDLARGVGVEVSVLRLARRTLLWARDQEAARPVTDLARTPPPARPHAYRAGFNAWLRARSPAELVDLERQTRRVRLRYDHTHDAFRPAALAEEAAEARTFVVRLLAQARPGAWHSVADLLNLIWRVHPTFLRGRQMAFSAPAWRIERISDGRPLRPTIRAEWEAAEGAYVTALLRMPLHTWGVIDLAADDDSIPRYFRLTPLGAFLLSRAEPDVESERRAQAALSFDWGPVATMTREGAVAVQPLAVNSALLDTLERWAMVTGLMGGRLVYTFGADLACANFDLGLSPEDALTPLRAAGLIRVAQTLGPRLEGWRAGYGDARLRADVTLIEGRDEATLREALASVAGLAARAQWLSPTHVTLSATDGAALREALTRKGWEP